MTVQTAAIVDVRPADQTSAIARWLRGIGVRQVRLVCGLIMFSYIFSHFFNHALGNFSYDTMEAWLRFHVWWWRIPVVNFALYAAATTHFLLGLWALYQRRHFRYTVIEITQLVFGLSIPLLIASHFGIVRLGGLLFGRDPPIYAPPLLAYWVARPYMVGVQFLLLTIAWTHACIGLYFWLRLKPFFKRAAPFLLAIAVLLPPLAMTGAHRGAHEVTERAAQPQWRAEHIKTTPLAQRTVIEEITLFYFPILYLSAIVLVFVARGVRTVLESRRGSITVSYPSRRVRVPRGLSILETSLRFNVPHASVCGGRARCSTCRVRVVSDRGALPRPSGREAFVLARVGAGANPSIRLACQLRPQADISVIPVLPANVGADFVRNRSRVNVGEERYVVSMFVDMRGSTKLAESRLPFDIVFLINRFLEAASQAVIDAGGQPNQFVGDGLLALFGLDADPATACRQAMRAASMVAANVEYMNHEFVTELQEPIQFGIGIHGGEVIIGDIGFRDHTVFTALGDAVNVAARLQDMTKTLNCSVVLSEDVCKNASVAPDRLTLTEVSIRGRDQPMTVCTAVDATLLASLLDEPGASPDTKLPVSAHDLL
ncbi:MAG: adenylate/guanylate cyclase domain-containing protein [Bradyrhizobium sp.]|uniref:adenylate/guanylate cyclase domain-containing protein n=1 Tax=Bradyrhizobium sp. TaxID=376 RepID=UPI001228CB32|nr:adenylate/guanylate cyclase domain-containing protein [Bradyrhizobium sp.]THD70218.1 MAG: adenylate/guanylate cyclase domain-containing protein [Bradyrhizobium sp.]